MCVHSIVEKFRSYARMVTHVNIDYGRVSRESQICKNTYVVFEGLQSPGRLSVIMFHTGGVSARRPQVVLPFSVRHRRARLAWCTQRWRWNNNQCSRGMFSTVSNY